MMKTKSLLMIACFFAGAALMSISAQTNDTKSDQYWVKTYYYTPVFCDGIWIDRVEGELTIHVVDHYKNGKWVWQNLQINCEATGMLSGETFKFHMTEKYSRATRISDWRYNMIGDMGSHYIGSLTYNYSNGDFTINKTVCH